MRKNKAAKEKPGWQKRVHLVFARRLESGVEEKKLEENGLNQTFRTGVKTARQRYLKERSASSSAL